MAKSRRSATARPRTVQPDPGLQAIHAALLEVAQQTAQDLGYFVEDVSVKRAGAKLLVRVVVDLPEEQIGAMPLDDVAEFSRELSTRFDAQDAIDGTYTLEVSTPGTSRPLTELRHFLRARTRLVTLTMRDGTTISGRLNDVVAGQLHLSDDQTRKVTQFALTDVVRGVIDVELKRIELLDEIEVED